MGDRYSDVRINTLFNVFSSYKINDRIDSFLAAQFGGSLLKTPLCKAMKRTLRKYGAGEYAHVKSALRVYQRRALKRRLSSHKGPTKYTLFCKQKKLELGGAATAGKLQAMWREKTGKIKKVPKPVMVEPIYMSESDSDEEFHPCTHDEFRLNPNGTTYSCSICLQGSFTKEELLDLNIKTVEQPRKRPLCTPPTTTTTVYNPISEELLAQSVP